MRDVGLMLPALAHHPKLAAGFSGDDVPDRIWYCCCMSPAAKEILDKVARWPQEDQEELAELAREIEARRTCVYVLSEQERVAIADARKGTFASDDDVRAFWKRVSAS